MNSTKRMDTRKMTLTAIMLALVIVLQFMGSFIRFGPFSISLVLLPIVIGASQCGIFAGGLLGLTFGIVVLASGDAALFMVADAFGTIVTVLLKGVLCGLSAAFAYKAFERFNAYVAVFAAAIVCPLVNTGVFLLGCLIFFMDVVKEWAGGMEAWKYMIFVLVGGNFLFEIAVNIILSPTIVRLINFKNK